MFVKRKKIGVSSKPLNENSNRLDIITPHVSFDLLTSQLFLKKSRELIKQPYRAAICCHMQRWRWLGSSSARSGSIWQPRTAGSSRHSWHSSIAELAAARTAIEHSRQVSPLCTAAGSCRAVVRCVAVKSVSVEVNGS